MQEFSAAAANLFDGAATVDTLPFSNNLRIAGALLHPLVVHTSATSGDKMAVRVNPLTKACLDFSVSFPRLPKNGDTTLSVVFETERYLTPALDYDMIVSEFSAFCEDAAAHGLHIFNP